MAFTHLHVHTGYSLLDGSNKIPEYVKRVKELGMTSAAITDHGVMFGCMEFYKEALNNGIKPILGCEVYVAPNSRFERELSGGDDRYYHLILLAENNKGYENLVKIVSKGFTEGYYYKPRVDYEVLKQYHEGIICLSACLAGEVQRYLVKGFYEEAVKAANRYIDIFGKENYFLELQDHGIPEQGMVNPQLIRMSKELGVELVATNDVHYTYADDAEAHDILLCIQTGKTVSDENRMRYAGNNFYVKSEEEMRALFTYAPEAIDNTAKIADRCNVEIEFHKMKLPRFEVPQGYTDVTYLHYLCEEGFKERFPEDDGTVHKQLEYELSVIENMGFVAYFLIVWDFINYSRSHGISVGPGRGSAAGSVVSYCLHITNINPVKYQLLFERFLNPDRKTMPDIDVDFCFARRHEVIEYVKEKYGESNVAQIATFGTLAAKGVIRDICRAMDMPYSYGDNIAKMIPNEINMTLKKAIDLNPELKDMYESDNQAKYIIDMGMKLEGLPRHTSVHAAGVLISPMPVDEFVPLNRANDGSYTTQYNMTMLEELGLLKMDFLGLRTLTVIRDAIANVKKTHGIDIDIDNIDLQDKKVLDYIGTGKTDGVFQLESGGMKGFMRELRPQSLEDVIAGISLYRPGPMDFIPDYIAGKNYPENITYLCPQLESILAPTYGCIVYQEQVMQIVRDLGGYSMGRSDEVRRAMSKKKTKVMEQERQYFVYGSEELGIPGCVGNGISADIGNKIYDKMIDFAKYAFNKSHAAAYAVVSFQTAFLKCYYPKEYMAALMTSVMDKSDKVSQYINATRGMGITLLPPDINRATSEFSVEPDGIRFALTAIKSVGLPLIETIVSEREVAGEYKGLKDFVLRTQDKGVNKRAVENFIKAGAFDGFGATRKQLMLVYEDVMDQCHKDLKNNIAGQVTLFDMFNENEDTSIEDVSYPQNAGEFGKEMLLTFEKDVLGVYVSGHPLDEFRAEIESKVTNYTTEFTVDEETGEVGVENDAKAVIAGIITGKKIKYTKNGNKAMCFLTVEDMVGSVEVIVFPRQYELFGAKLNEDAKVIIDGRVSTEEDKDAKLIAGNISAFGIKTTELWLKFKNDADFEEKKALVDRALIVSEGPARVGFFIEEGRKMKMLPENRNVNPDDELLGLLKGILGENNVGVKN